LAKIGEEHTLLETSIENSLVFSKFSPDIDKILYRWYPQKSSYCEFRENRRGENYTLYLRT
jgi:hypothetical protein